MALTHVIDKWPHGGHTKGSTQLALPSSRKMVHAHGARPEHKSVSIDETMRNYLMIAAACGYRQDVCLTEVQILSMRQRQLSAMGVGHPG
jgi:hypothetical protein